MLSLNEPIGNGTLPSITVLCNIHVNTEEVLSLVENNEIELDPKALQYLNEGKNGLGTLDCGPRTPDFFPNNEYTVEENSCSSSTESLFTREKELQKK